jgi:hypothetical protein
MFLTGTTLKHCSAPLKTDPHHRRRLSERWRRADGLRQIRHRRAWTDPPRRFPPTGSPSPSDTPPETASPRNALYRPGGGRLGARRRGSAPARADIQDLVRKKVSAQRSGALKTAAEAPVYVAADDGSGRNLPGQLTFDPDARAANPMPGGYQIQPFPATRPERQRGMPRPEESGKTSSVWSTLKKLRRETRVIATSTGRRYPLRTAALGGRQDQRITGLADDIALIWPPPACVSKPHPQQGGRRHRSPQPNRLPGDAAGGHRLQGLL